MTAARPKVLLIDDNPDFGGHQVMAAYGLEGMLSCGEWEVVAMHHPGNSKNISRWEEISARFGEDRLRLEPALTRSAKFQAVRRHLEKTRLRALEERVNRYRPDLILVIQGNIEQGCSVFQLCGRVSCPIVSYIPVPHKHEEMGAKVGWLRDLTCRGLYAEPDGFITISESLGEMLKCYGAKGRVDIVENGIPLDGFRNLPSKAEARVQLGLPQDGFVWGQVGRTEFKQKGQDFALDLFVQRSAEKEGEHFAFLGSGPDRGELASRTVGLPQVYCLPWMDDPGVFYAAIDALVLPSRYEGVPLAMIESLANGIPVASTDRDGMRDWLPKEWRFGYRDLEGGLAALDAVRKAEGSQIKSLKDRVWSGHSVAAFQEAFNSALERWV